MSGSTGRLDPAVADVRRAVRDACADLDPGQAVIVACSGGADSMALAAAALFEGNRAAWQVSAVIVDHGLQASSARTSAEVAERLRARGFGAVDVVGVDVDRTDGGVEAAARAARYAALDAAAQDLDAVVLLGHTRDDQAETVLLGLARGSGLRSIAGMPAVRGRYRRPLLSLPRATTCAACDALDIEVWDDPHNDNDAFARVRVRNAALPALEDALGPGVGLALARTADLARMDADALDAISVAAHGRVKAGDGLEVAALHAEPEAVRRRVLRAAALAAGAKANDLTSHHIDEVDRLITHWHGQSLIALPGGVVVRRVAGVLEVGPRADDSGVQG